MEDVRIILTGIWIALMLTYLLGDVIRIFAGDFKPGEIEGKFDFLDNESIASKFLEFSDGHVQITSFLVQSMHCSSCIWVLENLQKLNPGVKSSLVDFPQKTVRITYSKDEVSLKELVT